LDQFQEKYKIVVNFFKYNSIISAIRQAKRAFTMGESRLVCTFIPSIVQQLLRHKKGSKDMYDILNKCTTTPTGQNKWCEILDQPDLDWKKVYNLPFKVTKNTKLQWLQYRINHHILVTNHFLSKAEIIDNPDCTFCHTESETVQHLMWNCNFVKSLIENVNRWFLFHNINMTFNKTTFIFGETSRVCEGDPHNIIYLCVKQYIYDTRCFKKSLSFKALQEKLKDMYNIEKMLAVRNKCLAQFSQTWNIF
jgi:hypothetical protein